MHKNLKVIKKLEISSEKTICRIDCKIVRVSKIDPFKLSNEIKNELNLPIHM